MRKTKTNLIVLIIFIILQCSGFLKGQIQDTFHINTNYISGAVYCNLNSSFKIIVKGNKDEYLDNYHLEVTGEYFLRRGNFLEFKPKQIIEQDENGNIPKSYAKFNEISGRAQLKESMFIVKYGKIKILLSDSNALEVATLLNKKNAPIVLPDYIYRSGIETDSLFISKEIKENFPNLQKDFILNTPIECDFLSIDQIWYFSLNTKTYFPRWLLKFNKGKDHGIVPGLHLYKKASGFNSVCSVQVSEVSDSTATVYFNANQNGDERCKSGTFSTQYPKSVKKISINYSNHVKNAAFYFKEKKYEKALSLYEEAFQVYKKNGMDYFQAGILACQLGDNEKAGNYIRNAIENNFYDQERLHSEQLIESLRRSKYWSGILELMAKRIKAFKVKFNKVKDVPFVDLIPFKRGNKWGYLSRSTKEVLIQPEFEKASLGVECLKMKIADKNEILLFPDQSIQQFYYISPSHYTVNKRIYPEIVDNLPNGGFIVNDSCISFVSNIYDSYRNSKSEEVVYIRGPILIQGKDYAIVTKDKKMGIIDKNGVPLDLFDFNFFKLFSVKDFKGKGHWFYFEDFSNNNGFINESGEKRYVNYFDGSPFSSIMRAGYGVLRNGNSVDKFHVIDFETMELLHENVEYQFVKLVRQFKKCNAQISDQQRNNLQEIFCLVKDTNGNQFYMDASGESYQER